MRPLRERLRYVLLRGNLIKQGNEWVWVAAPDTECVVREMRCGSKWQLVEHPESAKSAEIRAKYLAEIERRNENDLSAKI